MNSCLIIAIVNTPANLINKILHCIVKLTFVDNCAHSVNFKEIKIKVNFSSDFQSFHMKMSDSS